MAAASFVSALLSATFVFICGARNFLPTRIYIENTSPDFWLSVHKYILCHSVFLYFYCFFPFNIISRISHVHLLIANLRWGVWIQITAVYMYHLLTWIYCGLFAGQHCSALRSIAVQHWHHADIARHRGLWCPASEQSRLHSHHAGVPAHHWRRRSSWHHSTTFHCRRRQHQIRNGLIPPWVFLYN